MLLALAQSRAAALALAAVGVFSVGVTAIDDSYRHEVEAWRAKHEESYRKEYVPLAGLFALATGVNTAGSAPGSAVQLPKTAPRSIGAFVLTGRQVRFEPAVGATGLSVKGRPVTAPVVLKDDENDEPD